MHDKFLQHQITDIQIIFKDNCWKLIVSFGWILSMKLIGKKFWIWRLQGLLCFQQSFFWIVPCCAIIVNDPIYVLIDNSCETLINETRTRFCSSTIILFSTCELSPILKQAVHGIIFAPELLVIILAWHVRFKSCFIFIKVELESRNDRGHFFTRILSPLQDHIS